MEALLRISNEVVHQIYFVVAGLCGLVILRGLFYRNTRKTIVYDIVYAYTIIPFLLRALHIK
jgi:hypothetical protein